MNMRELFINDSKLAVIQEMTNSFAFELTPGRINTDPREFMSLRIISSQICGHSPVPKMALGRARSQAAADPTLPAAKSTVGHPLKPDPLARTVMPLLGEFRQAGRSGSCARAADICYLFAFEKLESDPLEAA